MLDEGVSLVGLCFLRQGLYVGWPGTLYVGSADHELVRDLPASFPGALGSKGPTSCLLFSRWFLFVCLVGFGCPKNCSVDRADLELTDILLPLPPECGD